MRRSIKLLLALGLSLVVLGVGLLTAYGIRTTMLCRRAAAIAEQMEAVLPTATEGILAEGTAMPVWELDGQDMVALLTIPAYDVKLPVGATWGDVAAYPHLLCGSVYDRNAVIGGVDRAGQLDCLDLLEEGTQYHAKH